MGEWDTSDIKNIQTSHVNGGRGDHGKGKHAAA